MKKNGLWSQTVGAMLALLLTSVCDLSKRLILFGLNFVIFKNGYNTNI